MTRRKTEAEALARIARDVVGVGVLEERGSDRLDFHDVAVWSLRRALQLAYAAGREVGILEMADVMDAQASRKSS